MLFRSPGYVNLIAKLELKFPLDAEIVGKQAEKDFIRPFGNILSLWNILSPFDQFEEMQTLAARDLQDYQRQYIDLYDKYRSQDIRDKENINDDIFFETELIKQLEANIDYILMSVEYGLSGWDMTYILPADKALHDKIKEKEEK